VPYNTKVAEIWGAFIATMPSRTEYIILPGGAGGGGGGGVVQRGPRLVIVPGGTAAMSLEYPSKVTLHAGESMLITIRVNNTGDLDLRDIKLHTSLPETIEININPKVIPYLEPNSSYPFIVSLDAKNATSGDHALGFNVMADYANEAGNIIITILPVEVSGDEIREIILNYKLLITELEEKTLAASLKGFDVSKIEEDLNNTKNKLRDAEDYFNAGRYDDSKKKLKEVKEDIEKIVFELANLSIMIYATPGAFPLLMLLSIALLVVFIIALLYILLWWNRKRKRRPKLLRNLQEGEA
jgi:hypothetical protein